jgi:hypothetical protein
MWSRDGEREGRREEEKGEREVRRRKVGGVGEVDRGEADVWAHERVVGMEEKYEG